MGRPFDSVGAGKLAASLDRIDPNLGYTKTNIRVISRLANSMKWNATREELELFCRNMLKILETERPS